MAGTLFVLPSLLILIALSWVCLRRRGRDRRPVPRHQARRNRHRRASHLQDRLALRNSTLWAIATTAFVAILALNVPFPVIVAAAALTGYLGGRVAPDRFRAGGGHGQTNRSFGPAYIDDDTPPPEHTQFRGGRLAIVAMTGALLWAAPMGLLSLSLGWEHTHTKIGWFFTKAALLTFGGAYAVLPYVYQGRSNITVG